MAVLGVTAVPALASPHASVHPRVGCGAFKGTACWSESCESPYVTIKGSLSSSCDSYTVLYVRYTDPGMIAALG